MERRSSRAWVGRLGTVYVLLTLLLGLPRTGSGQPATPADTPAAPSASRSAHYGASWALLIGIDQYQDPRIPRLRHAANDVQAMDQVLHGLGFQTLTLLNAQATKRGIEAAFEKLSDLAKDDRLLIFFAGHGETAQLAKGSEEGFLVPYDANRRRLVQTGIAMRDIDRLGERLPPKHILFVLDACHAGFAFVGFRDIEPEEKGDAYYRAVTAKPVVQVLTAGETGQKAAERDGQGLFTRWLVQGLQGVADRDSDGIITANELAAWLEPQVTRDSRGLQKPVFGRLFGEGQFVFELPGSHARVASLAPARTVPSTSSATGDLDLTSDPAGATVRLDGREVGTTPLTLERVPVGEHLLELDKDGLYAARKAITIAAHTLERHSLKLERRKGKLTVFSEPRDARVFLDGRDLGRTPVSLEVEAGPYTLKLTKDGYKPHEEPLTLPADKETRTRIALRSTQGTLDVTSAPAGATVELAGTPRGQTPLTLTLEEGTYPLRLRLPRHRTATRQAEIQGERTTRLQVDLTPGPNLGDRERRGTDTAEMVYIPAGSFTMGDTHGDGNRDETPVHQVFVNAFWLDRTEVTNAQFARFVQAGATVQGDWRPAFESGKDQHPAFNVTWNDAVAYCRWADKRLPTEAEWEYAARGTDGRRYPWGAYWDAAKVNGGYPARASTPVGSYSGGASPFGVQDLAGNVWEWTSTLYKSYPYSATDGREDATASGPRVFRGGSWENDAFYLRSASRLRVDPADRFNYLGFRCAQEARE